MSLTLRRGDKVRVLSGRAKGKNGKIVRMDKKKNRAYVEGVNLVKRIVKKSRVQPQGGVIQTEAPIHLSNLALFDDKVKKAVRFGVKIYPDGSKKRVSKRGGAELDASAS